MNDGAPRSKLPVAVPASAKKSAVTQARGLKRRSISLLNGSAAKRVSAPTTAAPPFRTATAPRVTENINRFARQPLTTGRATMAAPGGAASYARPTTARSTTLLARSNSSSSARPATATARPKPVGVAARDAALNQKIEELEAQLSSTKEKLEAKEQILELKNDLLEGEKMKSASTKAKLELAQMEKENLQQKLQMTSEKLEHVEKELGEKSGKLVDANDKRREQDMMIRKLLNDVVDLKGQIRVAVRVRPILEKENEVCSSHLGYPSATSIRLDPGCGQKAQTFEFPKVFGPNFTQKRIFDDVQELILSVLHGYNVSIIAFGQTGSGKTYTMRGELDSENIGIIPRATHCIFANRDELEDLGWTFEFSASYVEVYNEEVFDLLGERKKVELRMGSGSVYADGLTSRPITNGSEIENVILAADRSRSVAATKCNEKSSRSHAIFELKVVARNSIIGTETTSSLHLVDLAGSERAKESGAQGDRFKEMTHINQGLTNLQMCIRSQMNKNSHIPYRNSKLTMLLMNCLGAGSSKTFVIVALNPALAQAGETKRSLEFARDMSNTKIGAAIRQEK